MLSATRRAFESVGNFVHNVLPKYQAGSLQVIGDTAEKGMEAEIENEKAVVVGRDGIEVQDGTARQRFKEELDLGLIPSPLLSPTPSSEGDEPESDGYWEAEDVWEEDNWLRGDGEDGIVFPSYTRGIPPHLPRELFPLDLANGDRNCPPDWTGFTSVNLNFLSSSSPSSPVPSSSRQELSDDDTGYFLNPLGARAPRRTKSASNLRYSFSRAGYDATRKHRNLGSQGSMPFPLSPSIPQALSMNTTNPFHPITPPSSPNMDLDSSSIGTRLYTLPSWVLIPNGEETKLKLKSHIALKSPQPVVSLTRCEM